MNSALRFNSNISVWNVSKVRDMSSMFFGTNLFNQDLSNWVSETHVAMYLVCVLECEGRHDFLPFFYHTYYHRFCFSSSTVRM
jgi:Mycoplasma protein of unknown function, DUF285